jgi:predicted PurR-regulated permease PerM
VLAAYVRGITLVALVDATLIGLTLLIVGVPLAAVTAALIDFARSR